MGGKKGEDLREHREQRRPEKEEKSERRERREAKEERNEGFEGIPYRWRGRSILRSRHSKHPSTSQKDPQYRALSEKR